MPSESDPLLPKGKPAPEISGFGYSPTPNEDPGDEEEKTTRRDYRSQISTSPLTIILALFTIVVGIGLFVALLAPGGLGAPDEIPRNHTPPSTARVDKILSENPLIGGPRFIDLANPPFASSLII